MFRKFRILPTRRGWKKFLLLVAFASFACCVIHMRIKLTIDHSWLDFTDIEPEDKCNCTKILQQDPEEIEQAKILSITVDFRKKIRTTDEQFIELARDCDKFIQMRKYLTTPLTQEEEEFPIAYSIVIHHKIQTFERLLRSIYAPQNFYCIHVDKKSPPSFLSAVLRITSCFENVFISSRLENVVYASWSRVQADINCMKDLYSRNTTWKYFLNLCGQDFPLKTNLEIVRKLKALKGKNSLETEKTPAGKEVRWKKHHEVVKGVLERTNKDKDPPPIDIPVFCGGAYIVVTRDFVGFVLKDPKALKFIEWAKDGYSPDEFLWATLQRMPSTPGSIPSNFRYDVTDVNSIARLVKWQFFEGVQSKGAMYPPCSGRHVRAVCVYGAGDLGWMLQQHHLFANKFDTDMDPFAVRCLEKYLRHQALKALI
ncbi:beta-1,3-galactosyl-O-glycosyl-glycoprotein beta-1,6-N-acetylglucosaminyltransferase-like [Megalops cyprinoides]|uniref:beta-1,3-galactosyl-O-glycosyl-glycoprotein beta-1,6-N-acetylglucosaminyltransferase-like n=1 Tax=Megalops cyprinoides TaxID=118141 RepID=UPI00186541F7|nr:beta-1,3-galactosyl-O-glycosyl-glycoprotein beta-1,6-N-acetylglucosaminyltransferase-like [Megalops cyprinoides]XP_036383275.1 beta-1,3-galactosyl-O-glycosyl-glycoprotein beta-1,6-N-acetylglucosaminyltransferase-like [Megalops cyprinoides]